MSDKIAGLLTLHPTEGAGDVNYRATIDPTFTIGPKVHGGTMQMLVAHAALRAYDDLVEAGDSTTTGASTTAAPSTLRSADLVPVAIASDYLAAPDPADVDLSVTLRKRGRTVTLLSVDLAQNGRLMVSSSVTLARPDSGQPHHSAPSVLDDLPAQPQSDGISIDGSPVGDVMHLGSALDLVLDPTSFPVARGETGEPVVRGWTRPKNTEPDVEFSVLVCDISPPVVMNLALFGWAPTVQLTTYVRRRPASGWLRFAASSTEVGPGMFEEDHLVVDSTGTVVAQSRQLALIPQRQG